MNLRSMKWSIIYFAYNKELKNATYLSKNLELSREKLKFERLVGWAAPPGGLIVACCAPAVLINKSVVGIANGSRTGIRIQKWGGMVDPPVMSFISSAFAHACRATGACL